MLKKNNKNPIEKTLYAYFPGHHHQAVAAWISEVSYYDALYMHLDDMVDGVNEKIESLKLNGLIK